ncbi:unnamed protein product [Symbiodinium sp. CCMP2456]|nr:unnamed protein product [Symbiodinium sp. CCMP2456]
MSRRCVSQDTASDTEIESDVADPSEMCEMQNLLDTTEHSVSDGLWPIYDQCVIIALAQFACAPLIFVVSCRGNDHAAGFILVLMLVCSTSLQYWLAGKLISWLRRQPRAKWQHSIDALSHLNGRCGMHCVTSGGLACIFGMLEAVDPALDAWAAANAYSLYTGPVKQEFTASWEGAPPAGWLVARLGLPGILFSILVGSMLCQLIALWWLVQRHAGRFDRFEEDGDEDAVFAMWYNWKHTTDIGGLLILHDVFDKLLHAELELDEESKLYPVVDRFHSFMPKVVAEALPGFWFQITVFALTYDSCPFNKYVVNIASITSSIVCVSNLLRLQMTTLCEKWHYTPKRPSASAGVLYWLNLPVALLALCCFIACLARFAGVWICPSHILVISHGCF